MILRIVLIGAVATGLVGFGTVSWLSAGACRPVQTVEKPAQLAVLTVARDIRPGALLRSEDFRAKTSNSGELPSGALQDTPTVRRELAGSMVRRALALGDVLRAEDVLRPGDHGFLAAVLKPGMRAVTVGVDAVTGTAGLIWPGDRVDVILTQTLEGPQFSAGQRTVAETVLQNALVIAIDQLIVQVGAQDGQAPTSPRTVTLEVTGREAERVQVAERIGRMSLAVRASELGTDEAAPHTQKPVWAGDVSHALGGPTAAATAPVTMRVFQGNSDGKEFKY